MTSETMFRTEGSVSGVMSLRVYLFAAGFWDSLGVGGTSEGSSSRSIRSRQLTWVILVFAWMKKVKI